MSKTTAAILLCVVVSVAAFARAEGYTVGPGDVLTIKVYGETDLSKEYEVSSEGTIRVPWLKDVKVEGFTPGQIEQTLEKLFMDGYLVAPQVSVNVKEYMAKRVYVLGQVKNPGSYSLKGQTTVLEAIAMAGGISAEGDKSFTLVRGGARLGKEDLAKIVKSQGDPRAMEDFTKNQPEVKVVLIDGYKLMDQGDLSQNLVLGSGDILSVKKQRFVYFDGEVKKPGTVPFEDGLTMMQAISLAGGLTTSASNKVVVTRTENGKNRTITLKLDKISKDLNTDFTLLPGDIVKVKRSIF